MTHLNIIEQHLEESNARIAAIQAELDQANHNLDVLQNRIERIHKEGTSIHNLIQIWEEIEA